MNEKSFCVLYGKDKKLGAYEHDEQAQTFTLVFLHSVGNKLV